MDPGKRKNERAAARLDGRVRSATSIALVKSPNPEGGVARGFEDYQEKTLWVS